MKNESKHLIGFYDYTVILTYTGFLLAVWGIFSAFDGKVRQAVFLLMWAGLCDMFDGAVASTKKRTEDEKRFGIQIDSLADLVSFGVLPASVAYTQSHTGVLSCAVAAVYILAALIRLAYFNVLEESRQKSESCRRKSYLGVPVTTIALVLPIVYILSTMGFVSAESAYLIALVPMAIGFLTPVEIRKPRLTGKIVMIVFAVAEAVGLFVSRSVI